jgi:hypothetical protein
MLGSWGSRFEDALTAQLLRRLGVESGKDDREVAAALISALATREASIDRIFFDWRGGRDPGAGKYPSEQFRNLSKALEGRERPQPHPYWSDPEPCSMHIDEVESIWSAISERDDWRLFDDKVTSIRRMGEAMRGDAPQG